MVELLIAFLFLPGDPPRTFEVAPWTCAPERWVLGPRYDDGHFKGVIETQCEVRDARGKGLSSLADHVRGYIVSGSKTVHSGPIAETWDGLPSQRWDITVEYGSASDRLTVRQDAHLANDNVTRFLYETLSSRVTGTGSADMVKRLDNVVEVKPETTPGAYSVVLNATLWAKKPWYAPSGVFMREAERGAVNAFRRARDSTMPRVVGNL
jgi:hypothetical protein